MAAYAVVYGCEEVGIRRRSLVVVADVNVHEARASLESLVRALYLLGRRDRESRIVSLARHRAGDRHRDHDRRVEPGRRRRH
jgi:hypothetical protein